MSLEQRQALWGQIEELRSVGQLDAAMSAAHQFMAASQRDGSALDIANARNMMGELCRDAGNNDEAEGHYREALVMYRQLEGPDSSDGAVSLRNIAAVHMHRGQDVEAERLLREVLDIHRRAGRQISVEAATALSDLAVAVEARGDNAAAEMLYRQAMDVCRRAAPPEDNLHGVLLNNLGLFYVGRENYVQAEALLHASLDHKRPTPGNENESVALTLQNLGVVYYQLANFALAEQYFRHALAIHQRLFGPLHTNCGKCIASLGAIYRYQRRFAESEQCLREDLRILTEVGFHRTTLAASTLAEQATLYAAMGDYARAQPLLREAYAIHHARLDLFRGTTSERELLAFAETLGVGYSSSLSLCLLANGKVQGNATWGLDLCLGFKGIVLEACVAGAEAAATADNPACRQAAMRLADLRQRTATLSLRPPTDVPPAQVEAELAGLQAQKEDIQRQLAAASQSYAAELRSETATTSAVAAALPADSALIEYARPRIYNFSAAKPADDWKTPRYTAFVLKSGAPEPALVDLGDAQEIDDLVARFRETVIAEKSRYERGAAGSRDIGLTAAAPRTPEGIIPLLQSLYQKVIAPLVPHIRGVARLFISPEGSLNLLPFAALVDPQGKFIVERATVTYLVSGRDLLRQAPARTTGAAIFADPDFDAQVAGGPQQNMAKPAALATRASAEGMPQWGRLPATRAEGQAIQGALASDPQRSPQLFLGDRASEEALRSIHRPRILHLATHGFFFGRENIHEPPPLPGQAAAPRIATQVKRSGNPMLQSGLVLSGANRLFRGAPVSGEDGWVTAEDVAGLDLHGTEMVVLSACDTGVGQVQRGEGVMGLRRAFRMAGARSLVMSLWKVPDQETQQLMISFYNKQKAAGDPSIALRNAMLGLLQHLRQNGRSAHPFYWAAFICEGAGAGG